MITRNPCIHPADIRLVTCVSEEAILERLKSLGIKENYFKELVNCVIFPKKGRIPLTAQISGADLDGDTFFITWDSRLLPHYNEKMRAADLNAKR